MADRIKVRSEWLDSCASDLNAIENVIRSAQDTLSGINLTRSEGGDLNVRLNLGLALTGGRFTGGNAREDIQALSRAAQAFGTRVSQLSSGARQAAQMFEQVEGDAVRLMSENSTGGVSQVYEGEAESWAFNLTGLQRIIDWFKSLLYSKPNSEPITSIKNNPFSYGEPYFGGDQGSVIYDYENHEKYWSIIERNTNHKLTQKEFDIYLRRMNNEGCGYIALCNMILSVYSDNETGFKKAFGFDMYNADGTMNYNELFVDLYSSWDNRGSNGVFNPEGDYNNNDDGLIENYDYWHDPTGAGTNIQWRGDIIENYLKQHGVKAVSEVHSNTRLTADSYNRLIESGKVKQGELSIRLSGNPVTLYDANGNKATAYSGGHAMTVTGTTGNGPDAMLEVSSWGQKYYIKPNESRKGDMGYMIVKIQS